MRSAINRYDELTVAKALDPAATTTFSEATDIRAEARLEQIIATTRHALRVAAKRPARTRAIRWATIPVAAASAIGLGIALPGGIGTAPAQASMLNWESFSTPLTDEEMSAADVACRENINEFLELRNSEFEVSRIVSLLDQPAVAERRGEWGMIGYPQDGDLAICLVWFSENGPQAALFESLGGGGAFQPIVGSPGDGSVFRGMGGPQTTDDLASVPMPDRVDVRATAEITIPDDADVIPPPTGRFTLVGGRVGDQVESLTLHTITGGDVEATVANGWWIAWWPGAMGGPEQFLVYKHTGPVEYDEFGATRDRVTMWEEAGDTTISGYTTTLADGATAYSAGDWGGCEGFNALAATWTDDITGVCFYDQTEARAQMDAFRVELAADGISKSGG